MGAINILDSHVANLISAGEVIERASNVVKELVENSIDAKATTISISLIEAGLKEIDVKDNGCGMDLYDARLCFEPHATSKIKTPDDLYNISTLGFRGEALPSIVAVSNFTMKTSIDGGKGVMYSLRGGSLVTEAMVSCAKGTQMIVRNLFFNTPARLQNLQSASIELSYIVDYVQKEALAHPDISFKLLNNEKVIFQTYGTNNQLEVLSLMYSNDISKSMRDIFNKNGYFKITGYISKNDQTRSSRNHMFIFVNKRPIKSNNIFKAILDGYDQFLTIGRYPICIINIEVDTSLVDVNVHPSKLEVRFSNEEDLLELIRSTISDALKNMSMIVNLDNCKSSTYANKDQDNKELSIENDELIEPDENDSDLINDVNEESEDDLVLTNDFVDESENSEEEFFFDDFKKDDSKIVIESNNDEKEQSNEENTIVESVKETFTQQEYSFQNPILEDKRDKLPKMTFLSQLFGTYLLCQDDNRFYLIDQHAANERINYEKIKRELSKSSIISYELLVPIKVEFSVPEAILVNEKLDTINNLGIKLEDFGGGTFTIREIPVWIFKGREKEFVEEIVSNIIRNTKSNKEEFLDNLAKSLACKKSIKANQYISKLEAEYMLDDLENCNNPYTCPHGRPVIVSYSKYEIEKWFKRIQ